MDYVWTDHARERAQQRFATVDLDEVLRRARPAKRRVINRMLRVHPFYARKIKDNTALLLVSVPDGVVFAVDASCHPRAVITVMSLP